MHQLRRRRYLAPFLHVCLFALTWIMNLVFPQALLDGPAVFPFAVLFVADIPISLVCFGLMFSGRTVLGLSAWGVLGTLWWYLLGLGMEKRLQRS
jgi:hypothetical protein